MWFKNMHVYRVPQHWKMTADDLIAHLLSHTFTPLGDYEVARHGWVEPRGEALVHTVQGQMLLTLATEKKLLPAHVIRRVARERADKLEEEQGFRPGKKAMKELTERVADELLPKAFKQLVHTHLWIDPKNGWLAVDTASASRSDAVIKMLIRSIDKLPLESLHLARSPLGTMTTWLQEDEAPHGFTVDQDVVLQAAGDSKATVKYTKHTLDPEEMRRHIANGKQVKSLALTWRDKVSFVLKSDMTIARIRALDVLQEGAQETRDDQERFDNDMVLMTSELNALLSDLIDALGGMGKRDE